MLLLAAGRPLTALFLLKLANGKDRSITTAQDKPDGARALIADEEFAAGGKAKPDDDEHQYG
jgi:hypothetical protein